MKSGTARLADTIVTVQSTPFVAGLICNLHLSIDKMREYAKLISGAKK